MTFKFFFNPTVPTVVPALIITAVATGLMYYSLNCGLDASGSCTQIPLPLQLFVIALLWPWVAVVRIVGVDNIAFGSVLGIVASFAWVFLIVCAVRLVAHVHGRGRERIGK